MSFGPGALIAHLAFWAMVLIGWGSGALKWQWAAIFLTLWTVGYVGLVQVPYVPFMTVVAVLDIALIFIVLKGDVRLH